MFVTVKLTLSSAEAIISSSLWDCSWTTITPLSNTRNLQRRQDRCRKECVWERDLINRFLLEWCFIKINWKLVTKQQPVKGYSDQRGKETGQCFFSNPRKWQEMTVTEGWTPLPTTGSWKGRAWPLWSRRQPCPIYPFNKHKAWSECMTARTDTLNNSNSPQRELQRLKHLACVYQIFWR